MFQFRALGVGFWFRFRVLGVGLSVLVFRVLDVGSSVLLRVMDRVRVRVLG